MQWEEAVVIGWQINDLEKTSLAIFYSILYHVSFPCVVYLRSHKIALITLP